MHALPTDTAIAVIGAGAMGRGIAQVAATAGHPVYLYDAQPEMAERAKQALEPGLEKLVSRGKIDDATRDGILARIQPVESLNDLAAAGLVIEAIVENPEIKQGVFRELEALCPADTILASNTSSLSITAIAAGLDDPARLVGMHFFNPAQVMKLVEVVTGIATGREQAECVLATARAWGKEAVFAKSTPGFIVNRVARPFYAEAWRMLEEGMADAASIDAALTGAGGFRMGPFALMDLIGHDINFAVTNSVYNACYQDPRYRPSLMQQDLVLAGHLGRKSGRGIYSYEDGAKPPAPVLVSDQPAPDRIILAGSPEKTGTLESRIKESGIPTTREEGPGLIRIGDVTLTLTDGRSASQRAMEDSIGNLVLFDLALDYSQAGAITLAKADQAAEGSLEKAAALFQALGIQVLVAEDSPALVVMRTVAMLANEASETVAHGVAEAQAVDLAMTKGVNYPIGPLAFAERAGLNHVLLTVQALHRHFGEDRYRPSPLLHRKVLSGRSYHD